MFKFDHSKYVETGGKMILKPGICQFLIKNAEQTQSKSGDPMLKLELAVKDSDGVMAHVFDYILAKETFLWKIKHLCDAIGHPEIFLMGEIDPGFLKNNKRGKCIIKVEDNGEYGKQNRVKDYMAADGASVPATQEKKAPNGAPEPSFDDDDLPF